MDSSEVSQYKGLFFEEMEEQLQLIEGELLRLEKEGESERGIQSLFRAAHTLKGSSSVMGFHGIMNLTHEMENILEKVRSRHLNITSEMIGLLFNGLDHLQMMKADLIHDKEISVNIDVIMNQFHEMLNHSAAVENKVFSAAPIVLTERQQVEKRLELNIFISPACEMKLVRCMVILNQLQECAEVIQCQPPLEEQQDDSLFENIKIVCVTNWSESEIKDHVLSYMDVEKVEVYEIADSRVGTKANESPTLQKKRNTQSTIRVNIEHLEQLMNLVGELVIDQTRINNVKSELLRKYQSDKDIEELESVSDHVNKVVSDLRNNIMKVRMIAIEHLFNRFPRLVRDLGQSLHKEVELELSGTETEMDRSLIEEIGDPLIHLIRNAMDHGIEEPSLRVRNGKSSKGHLRITAAHEDNQVIIKVEDDGAGIDINKIRQTAIHKGIITLEESVRLTDQETIYLIFNAGFSTARAVSEVSGRGVGMDIVKSHIEKLNGLIDIETKLGEGTRFIIKLPLTLAIISGLLVKLHNQTYIIPMSNISEIVKITRKDIHTVRGQLVVFLRHQVIPLEWIHDHINISRFEWDGSPISIVIVGSAERRLALVVDELIGIQEVVIKSLGAYVGTINNVAGATILGDGKVALILDISSFIRNVQMLSGSKPARAE
ncbi:chemotaxis protein CheA [Paenibacillus sp. FSL F4-0125]|uniref:chemotaxis protein CheA n=1 Tax=Paenibacillus sp. FSL F4-0125 TaxID=2954730 RepID=UPI0030F9330D